MKISLVLLPSRRLARTRTMKLLPRKFTFLHTPNRRLFSAVIFITMICFCYFYYHSLSIPQEWYPFLDMRLQIVNKKLKNGKDLPARFLIDTPGCTIPLMDPYDSEIKTFLKTQEPISCGINQPRIMSNITTLFLPGDVVNETSHTCCYQQVRLDKSKKKPDDSHSVMDPCVEFPSTGFNVPLNGEMEFLSITCEDSNGDVEKDFHAFVPKKREVEERCKKAENSSSKTDKLSVMIIGLDSISRLNFYRQMPKTAALLKAEGGIELLGYNKVGDNTFPNLVPILSGMSKDNLRHACWKNKMKFLDDCPWIWKNYANSGYRTMFIEDAPYIGMFSFEKQGFKEQPTDYYPRAYMNAYESQLGHDSTETCHRCVGERYVFEVLLDYVTKFATTFSESLYWGLLWSSSVSHDNLNTPQLADPVFYKWIRNMIDSNSLRNTVLIMMSDHGIRLGTVRKTYQGRMEERLPYISFLFPKWFQEKYVLAMENLRSNVRRLTSPFDIYSTMEDLLHLQDVTDERITKRTSELFQSRSLPRGICLFLPVPVNRTCKDAGIETHWCTCHSSSKQDVAHPMSKRISEFIIDYLNNKLKPYPICAPLSVATIVEVRVHEDGAMNAVRDQKVLYYFMQLEASPSGALLEVTVKYIQHKDKLEMSENTVSRINRYGQQSACITGDFLRLICYCANYTEPTGNTSTTRR